jgi:hypothetical protein
MLVMHLIFALVADSVRHLVSAKRQCHVVQFLWSRPLLILGFAPTQLATEEDA